MGRKATDNFGGGSAKGLKNMKKAGSRGKGSLFRMAVLNQS